MQKICSITNSSFTVSAAEIEYCRDREIPLPTLSPLVRFRNMLAFRNRSDLYYSKCALSKKTILSSIPTEFNFKATDIDVWNSDSWNPLDFGKSYDFKKSFFQQFGELLSNVPIPNLAVMRSSMENSDYTNGITGAKNCYLIFACNHCEDCLYSKNLNSCRNVVDSNMGYNSELCYNCNNINASYNLKYSENCFNCSDSYFLNNCQACTNCFGCVNLTNKQYHFYNQALSKAEYQKKLASFNLGSMEFVVQEQIKFNQFKKDFPIKCFFGKNNHGSSGNFLSNVKNCWNSYLLSDCENMQDCLWVIKGKSSIFHCTYGLNSELVYNSVTVGDNAYNINFCVETWEGVSNLEYCMFCIRGTSDCFGCVGLKKNSYCILNKQYSKVEYFDLLKRIKAQMRENGEYGQFFPVNLSPFYFNHSEANYYLPLEKAEALKQGFQWKDDEDFYEIQSYIVPDNINEVKDDILDQVLICAISGKKFKLIKQELEFYRKQNIPIPIIAPIERLKEKAKVLKIEELKKINCAKCQKEIQSTYNPILNKIYCEECFQKEVY